MTPDVGRQAVYAAEIAAFEGTSYESLTTIDELLGLAASITTADWWSAGQIDVLQARSDAGSSSTRQRGSNQPVVRLAAPQMTPATLVHELAHVLAGVRHGHGDVFRRAHVDLAGYAFGPTRANWLIEAYAAMGLTLGSRAWPAPPIVPIGGGPISL